MILRLAAQAVVFGNAVAADFFGDVTQAFDFRHKGVDVFFRDDEIVVIPGFDVGALQQSEQPLFFRGVTRKDLRQLQRVRLAFFYQKFEVVFFVPVENVDQRDRFYKIFGCLMKLE